MSLNVLRLEILNSAYKHALGQFECYYNAYNNVSKIIDRKDEEIRKQNFKFSQYMRTIHKLFKTAQRRKARIKILRRQVYLLRMRNKVLLDKLREYEPS
jgi:hypothetical protein